MRHNILGATLICALISAIAPTALSLDSSQPDQHDPSPLARDELYIRDGAVTKFDTCLAVADDTRAFNLWQSTDPEIEALRASDEGGRAEKLAKLPTQLKHQLGFGTIYACAQIIEAWHSLNRKFTFDERFQTTPGPQDGRHHHGTVVVDLTVGKKKSGAKPNHEKADEFEASQVLRGSIQAVPLVRILTSPLLLPPRAFGGIVIRNADINGALLFHNVHLSIPLSFANVWFRGYNYEKDVFGENVEAPVKDRAIAIVNSRFGDRIQISASKLCGDVRITESRFAESLKFLHVEQRGITCEPYDPDTPPKIRIDSSTFGQGLTTVASSFAMLDVYSSAIHSFSSSRTNFGRRLRVWESDIGSMQVDCSTLADTVDISYNYVSKDLFVTGIGSNMTGGVPCRNWWKEKSPSKKTQLTISSNKIGGGLGLSDFLASRFGPEIDLTSNRVGNGSEIYLPAPDDIEQQWQGEVKLEGSSYEGKIEIAVDQVKVADSTEEQPFEIADTYCPPATGDSSSGATIDFRAARIRTLVWNLPLTCAYRWSGYGLTYDLWLAGENPKKSVNTAAQDSDQEVLKAWRTTLVRYQSASLDAMSRYLAEKGAYVESRAILLEAKRLNYAPDCPPHSSALSCIVDLPSGFIPTGPWSLSANAQDAGNTLDANDAAAVIPPDKAGPSRFQSTWRSWFGETMSSIWGQVWKILMLVLLWPGGYGAAPERTIILTGILAVIFFAVYWYYSRRLEHKLTAVPGYPKGMLTIKTRSLEEASAQSDRPDGLGDVARSEEFTHDALGDRDQPSSDATQSSDKTTLPWPTKLEWGGLDANRRLSVIQDILRPAIEKQAEKSSKANQQSELRELRKRLEWFGNTETLGFSLFDRNRMPTRFTHWLYSVDTMLPFIDLHAYGNYYAESGCIRAFSVVQHVLGWWLITVFIASAAIL